MSLAKKRERFVLGIGTRLTLWGAGLTTLLCALLGGALYLGVFFTLRSQIDAFLEGEITEFLLTVNEHVGNDTGLQEALRHELGSRDRNDLGFRLIDIEGKIIVSSVRNDPLDGLWLPPGGWETQKPTVVCETLRPSNEPHTYRVCNRFVVTADGRKGTAQSSYLLDEMTQSLASFRRVVALALIFAFFIALAVGGFLSRRSLQPIRSIMQAARSIGTKDLGRRLALSGTGDEMDQLAGTLNGMLERVERQVREIQRFTADASHELRTPLAALRGHAEVALSQRRSADDFRHTIEESIGQYDRLQRIADDLLLLAKCDAGEAVVLHERISLDRVVGDVVDLYFPIADDKGLSLSLDIAEPVLVNGDGGRLRQVMGNLVDNAIKYTPPAGQVRMSLARTNGNARIEVEDTGIGISPDDLLRVFDRFYRADPSRSGQSAPGIGLGLSICRSIIEVHGGTVTVDSEMGKGTKVCVTLPIEEGNLSIASS
jgi:heavy metal sensor kinase